MNTNEKGPPQQQTGSGPGAQAGGEERHYDTAPLRRPQANPEERYPNRTGWKGDLETGRLAALDFDSKLGRRQAETLAALKAMGLATAEEIAAQIDRHWFHVRPRLSELRRLGLIQATAERGLTEFGKPTVKYRASTPEEVTAFKARAAA